MKNFELIDLVTKAGFRFGDKKEGDNVQWLVPEAYSQRCFERLLAEHQKITLDKVRVILRNLRSTAEMKEEFGEPEDSGNWGSVKNAMDFVEELIQEKIESNS